ncbi:nitric oxide synthase 3-like [Cetorhinus maximus]
MMENMEQKKAKEPGPESEEGTSVARNSKNTEDSLSRNTTFQKPKFMRLKNWESGILLYDTLHQQTIKRCPCSEMRCLGSIMFPEELISKPEGEAQSKKQLLQRATVFLNQYYTAMKREGTLGHSKRLTEVEVEVQRTGSYQLMQNELIFGAKQAWRNAARCVGRIQWSRLQSVNHYASSAKAMQWDWGTEQEAAYAKIKQPVMTKPVLKYDHANDDITLTSHYVRSGSSSNAARATSHIYHAGVSETERHYTQIEKECMATVSVCEQFHHIYLGETT